MIGSASVRSTRWALVWTIALTPALSLVSCTDDSAPDGAGGEGGESPSSGGTSSGGRSNTGGAGDQPTNSGGAGGEGGEQNSGGQPAGGNGSGGSAEPGVHVSTPDELTDTSHDEYSDNEHGIITGDRLKAWASDWTKNRPAQVSGNLVIFQVVPSNVTSFSNFPTNEAKGVYSYLVGADSFSSPRDNGFSAFETDIPEGAKADAWLKRYAVDPTKDLIVLVFEQQGNTQNTIVHSIGRAWLFLKYWGVQSEHIAILNGSINYNARVHNFTLSPTANHKFSDPPNNGTLSFRDLKLDNTALSIPLEELISILDKRSENITLEDGYRIVDARGGAESLGLAKASSTGRTNCSSYTGTAPNAKCSTPFEGRIKGAQTVPWAQFLDTAENGFRFLPKATVRAVFDVQSWWNGGAQVSIHYCRTNQRSTVTGIVANTILGYPTRFYETSFIEWGHASAGPEELGLGGAGNEDDFPNKRLVASDFPFRTDLDHLTEHAVLHPDDTAAYVPGGTLGTLTRPVTWVSGPNYNAEADIAPPVPGVWPKLRPDAETTRLSIDQDRAYLRNISIEELPD